MSAKIEVRASRVSSAEPSAIYALLANSASYPLWSMIRYYASLRPGQEGLHEVGALRLFKTNAITVMREEITEVIRDQRVGYKLLSGFPLLDYQSYTTLQKIPAGTEIVWESSFYPKYPLTGWYWRSLMNWVLKRLVDALADTAENPELLARILALADEATSMSKDALRQGKEPTGAPGIPP